MCCLYGLCDHDVPPVQSNMQLLYESAPGGKELAVGYETLT